MKSFFSLLFLSFFYTVSYAQIIDDYKNIVFNLDEQLMYSFRSFATDLDNDGDQDVITIASVPSNSGASEPVASRLAWFEHLDGQGNFSTQKFIDMGLDYVHNGTTGDLDKDGFQDIIIVDINEGIFWYRNVSGQGTFEKNSLAASLSSPKDVQVADIDGDGYLDIVSASSFIGPIAWFKNLDGTGNFGPQQIVTTTGGDIRTLKLEDLDNDGDVDLIAGGDCNLGWYENLDGAGNFGLKNSIWTGDLGDIYHVETADLNSDGLKDIMSVSLYDDEKTAWRPNLGNGAFGDYIDIDSDNGGFWVHSNDMDADGDADVLVSSDEGGLHFYKNIDGQGTLEIQSILYPTDYNNSYNTRPQSPYSISTVDLDNDSDLDILTNYYNSDRVGWHKNADGQGDFEDLRVMNIGINGLNRIKVEDINGDGDQDLLTISSDDDRIGLFENIEAGGIYEEQRIISTLADFAIDATIADIDNDGDKDVVSISYRDKKIAWYENLGGNQFANQNIIVYGTGQVNALVCTDFDNDGYPDILIGNDEGTISWHKNIQGSGTFQLQAEVGQGLFPVKYLLNADLDNDGDQDIIVGDVNSAYARIGWYENTDGLGSFGTYITLGTSPRLLKMMVDDLDSDGDQDVITMHNHSSEKNISWYTNLSPGNFSQRQEISIDFTFFADVYVADLNMDGDQDIITLEEQFNDFYTLNWYEGLDGDGRFSEAKLIFEFLISPNIVIAKDLDNDEDVDILIGSNAEREIYWYENTLSNADISGYCYYDKNENQVRDPNEIGLSNQIVQIFPDPVFSYPDGNGKYRFFVDNGPHLVTALPFGSWQLTTRADTTLLYQGQPFTNVNFGFIPSEKISSIEPDISSGPTRCGFDVPFWLNYQNAGTTFESGYIKFLLAEGSSLQWANPVPDTIIADTLYWDFIDIGPTEQKDVYLTLQMPGVARLGDTIDFVATSFLVNNGMDIDTVENTIYTYRPVINCAYDPNDKNVIPAGVGEDHLTLFDTEFEYTIRFQNTGTDTAFTVRLEDVLDADLDWTTFRPVSASHNYVVDLSIESGLLTFLFENILLPDSTTNEVGSHGFVKYRILPKQGLSEDTEITNEANIFFDFNPPILTNTTLNTMVSTLINTTEINRLTDVKVVPNPFDDYTSFIIGEIPGGHGVLNIFDSKGALVFNKLVRSNSQEKLSESGLVGGVYFYEIINDENVQVARGKVVKL